MKSFHLGAAASRATLWLAVASSPFFAGLSSAQDGKDCQPYTWNSLMRLAAADDPADPAPTEGTSVAVEPGEISCRYWGDTPEEVSYFTCSDLATRYEITNEQFFFLNPGLKDDCSNIEPLAEYCVDGCELPDSLPWYKRAGRPPDVELTDHFPCPVIEPVRASDGFCGPKHNDATCLGTDKQCCNSETWTCGDSE